MVFLILERKDWKERIGKKELERKNWKERIGKKELERKDWKERIGKKELERKNWKERIGKKELERKDWKERIGKKGLERKNWKSMFEQLKASIEPSEIQQRIDQAAHLAALAEAKEREENLKRALGDEEECMANIEKAMHDMRVKAAETKVAGEMKLAEVQAREYEVEAREYDLRRRVLSFKYDCDAKENKIIVERQALCERQKVVKEGQERSHDAQALLTQLQFHG